MQLYSSKHAEDITNHYGTNIDDIHDDGTNEYYKLKNKHKTNLYVR